MNNTLKNILTGAGIALIVAETILVLCLCSANALAFAIILPFCGIIGAIYARFAYPIARRANKLHMRRFKEYEENKIDIEPSEFIVRRIRISGIVLLVISQIIFIAMMISMI